MGAIILLRALVVLVVLRLLGRLIAGVIQGMREEPLPASGSGREMVRDHVCNTFLPRNRALRAVIDGQEAHFCSPACRDRALAARPAR